MRSPREWLRAHPFFFVLFAVMNMTGQAFDFRFLEQFGIPLKRFRMGSNIFTKGDSGDSMFVVLEGKVKIAEGDTVLEQVGLYGIFGEMALIDQGPRSANAIAESATEVAVINEPTFIKLVGERPAFSLYVMRQLAARIRRMNENL